MKILLVLLSLNAIEYSQLIPLGGAIGGGFVKTGSISGSIDGGGVADGGLGASGGAGLSASFSGGIGGGGIGGGGIGGGGIGGGEIVKTVTIEKQSIPSAHGYYESSGGIGGSGGASFSASFGGHAKHSHGGRVEVLSEKVLEVENVPQPPVLPAKKTVIERTLIPNYVEKTIQVPTYVEKTIRVPTYVEKTIKVPAAPTIVERTISHEEVPVPTHKEIETKVKVEGTAVIPPIVEEGNVEVYHRVKVRPHRIHHKEFVSGRFGGDGYAGGSDYAAGSGSASGYGSGGGAGGFRAYASAGGNGRGLFDGIFNIPIQALGATKDFLGGLSGGFSADGGFGSQYGTY